MKKTFLFTLMSTESETLAMIIVFPQNATYCKNYKERHLQVDYLPVRYPHQGGSTYWLHWWWWGWQAYWSQWREVWRAYCYQQWGWSQLRWPECRLGMWALRGQRRWRGEGGGTLTADSEGGQRKTQFQTHFKSGWDTWSQKKTLNKFKLHYY